MADGKGTKAMKTKRLDDIILEKGWVKDKKEAFVVVTEGRVFLDGQKAISPAQLISPRVSVELRAGREYVGRGAYKLEAAMRHFQIDASGKICADIGAATGGFTEVLLRRGAKKVYAIDTAKGKLALKLREDPRVSVMEETDVRRLEHLPEVAELVTIDISLISLKEILPSAKRLMASHGEVVALFKPQYETHDQAMLHHGIIKTDEIRKQLLDDFSNWLHENAWNIKEQIESPIRGSKGNTEYLFYLRPSV